jgi:hypothetical protein
MADTKALPTLSRELTCCETSAQMKPSYTSAKLPRCTNKTPIIFRFLGYVSLGPKRSGRKPRNGARWP